MTTPTTTTAIAISTTITPPTMEPTLTSPPLCPSVVEGGPSEHRQW